MEVVTGFADCPLPGQGSAVRRSIIILAALAATVTLAAAKSKLVTSWKNPAYSGPALRRILIIGIAPDPGPRADFEDDLSQRITRDGMEAIPGNTLLLRSDSHTPDLNYLRAQIRDHKVEGVIVCRMVSLERTVTTFDPMVYSHTFYGYYGAVSAVSVTPGYVRVDTKVRIESNLYSMSHGEGELLWTATSDAFDPGKAHKEIASLSQLVVKELEKDGFLGAAKK